MVRLANVLGILFLVLGAVAAWDSTRPVTTWREPGPLQLVAGKHQVWVFLEVRRRFHGQGLLAFRGPEDPLSFQKVVTVRRDGFTLEAEAFPPEAPRLGGGALVELDRGQPLVELPGDERHRAGTARWTEPHWNLEEAAEAPGPAAGARIQAVLVPDLPARGRVPVAPGGLAMEVVWVVEGSTGRLLLREAGEGGREVLLHRFDLEPSTLDRRLLREQRATQAPLQGPAR